MKPKSIGIIGGAGPMAGAYLIERIMFLSGSKYGCYKDADFPEVNLLSYPFSEMLTPEMDVKQLRIELRNCLNRLRNNGAAVVAIACNTLHAFLDEDEDLSNLIQLTQVVVPAIPKGAYPLVLCTTTSVQFGLHKRFFPCVYPDKETQLQVDRIIKRILQGEDPQKIAQDLLVILHKQTAEVIVLGCTELSLFNRYLQSSNKIVIDPLEIAVDKILETSFKKY